MNPWERGAVLSREGFKGVIGNRALRLEVCDLRSASSPLVPTVIATTGGAKRTDALHRSLAEV